jgi:hypothetical protein
VLLIRFVLLIRACRTVGFRLSATGAVAAAKAFFRKAIQNHQLAQRDYRYLSSCTASARGSSGYHISMLAAGYARSLEQEREV